MQQHEKILKYLLDIESIIHELEQIVDHHSYLIKNTVGRTIYFFIIFSVVVFLTFSSTRCTK